MTTPKKEEIWRVLLAVEPSLRMGYTSRNGQDIIGCADLLYNYLNYLLKTELKEAGVIFNGVELVLWKGKGNLSYYPVTQVKETVHDTILGFAQNCIHDQSIEKRAKFITRSVSPLCTGEAITLSLEKLETSDENTKTLFFVMSDDPRTLSGENVEGLKINFLPDLTVFILSEEAVADGCSVIADFNTENSAAAVYDIRSWHKDVTETLKKNELPPSGIITTRIFDNALRNSIAKKCGVCYAICGIIKDALNIAHSHGKNQ